ncbi:MAG: PAS domain-containing protein, partial [Eubacteriales bacterium]|nr:PAS domain-containing protein [Eubacteriales bacterium]
IKDLEQAHYQELLEHLGISIFELDESTGHTTVSESFRRYAISDHDLSTLTSHKDLEPFIHPDDWPLFWQMSSDLLADGQGTATLRLQDKEGHYLWCRVQCMQIYEELTRKYRYIAAINEVDEQIRIQENYQREQSQFRAFADNFMVGLGIFEMRGEKQRLLYLSNGYRRMVGYAPAEGFTNEADTYSTVYPDDIPRFQKATYELIRTGVPFKIDYRVYHKDGRILWMRSFNSIYPTSEPGVSRIYAVIEEITELKVLRGAVDQLMNHLPLCIGIYGLDHTPSVHFENAHMEHFWRRAAQPAAEKPAECISGRDGLLAYILQQKEQGMDQIDQVITLARPGRKPEQARLLYSIQAIDERQDCFCVLLPSLPTS